MAVKLEDSNIAGIGSDMDEALRRSAAQSEEQFEGAGSAEGIEVWRIEKFEPVRIAGSEVGVFFSGDSYVILRSYKEGDSDELVYDLFFWLGKDSTQDEKGAAAYFTVNVDDLLGGKPVQFREVQGSESEKFCALFPIIQTVDGGVDSGFTTVQPESYVPKLLQVKGKNPVRVNQVPMTFESLNNGDVFILDAGEQLYQWNSSGSGPFERNRAAEVCAVIEHLRDGAASTEVIDGEDIESHATFWELLGDRGTIGEATSDLSVPEPDPVKKLFRASHDGHSMTVTLVEEGDSLSRGSVDVNDIFTVSSNGKAFVYQGQNCSTSEAFYVKFHTEWILEQMGLPSSVPVVLVKSDHPCQEWASLFS